MTSRDDYAAARPSVAGADGTSSSRRRACGGSPLPAPTPAVGVLPGVPPRVLCAPLGQRQHRWEQVVARFGDHVGVLVLWRASRIRLLVQPPMATVSSTAVLRRPRHTHR